ncbi:hypothetical protein TRFO_23938 [Tritrichomonas foetus]|uniref:DUF4200 domain-containing protein n=1 Tax=Tritrichomonas foetus TaxID=1144522 RepID=A0A1J4KA03_9EUKA|nr:hypothetical protein TRFO_23938 [Tritrichomonas foetus]|eukprot:OHT07752.1 hypothetical protein TRFO_23938 [Tritrichomonas foetus]
MNRKLFTIEKSTLHLNYRKSYNIKINFLNFFMKQKRRPQTALRLNFSDYDSDTKINPYDLPDDHEVFKLRDAEQEQITREMKTFTQKPLMYRNCPAALPSLGPCPSHLFKNTKKNRTISRATSRMKNYGECVQPVGPEYQCKEELHDFVNQKREIFFVQLLIDRKKKEIERIRGQEHAEAAVFKDQENKIAETKNQYKMTSNQLEAELSRLRKIADIAAKQRAEASASLKIKKARLLNIENEIAVNEETARAYRNYHSFLKAVELDYDRETLFKNPKLILDELEKLENDNLFLFEKCAKLKYDQERISSKINAEIEKVVDEQNSIYGSSSRISNMFNTEIIENSSLPRTPEIIALDDELARLTIIINDAYAECFGKCADISPLIMLEKIENELEAMFKESKSIPEKEILEKQNAKEKERREKQRIEKQMAQILEQQAKNDAAIQRSKMPIKKRTGRPLVERCIPIKVCRHVNTRNLDEEYQERLLYGPISD